MSHLCHSNVTQSTYRVGCIVIVHSADQKMHNKYTNKTGLNNLFIKRNALSDSDAPYCQDIYKENYLDTLVKCPHIILINSKRGNLIAFVWLRSCYSIANNKYNKYNVRR